MSGREISQLTATAGGLQYNSPTFPGSSLRADAAGSLFVRSRETMTDIFDIYPTLRHAVQPAKLPKVSGSWRFDPSADWQQFLERASDFRFPQSDRRNWAGPIVCIGDCLDPFGKQGDLSFYDPTLEPQDGDFVLVAWGPQALASRQFQSARARWLKMYGCEPGEIATKRLRRMGSDWLLCVRNSHYWLDDSRVLGVMVEKERANGVRPFTPRSCVIAPGAATNVYFDSDNYGGTGFGNGAELETFTFTPEDDCVLEISSLAVADDVLGDSGNNLRITVQPTGGSESVLGATGANSATRQEHTIYANYFAAGGVEITIRHKTLVSGPSINVWTSTLRIAEIKR